MVAGTVVAPDTLTAGYTIYDCETCDKTEEKDFVMPLCNEVQNVVSTVDNDAMKLLVEWDALDRASKYIVYVYDEDGNKVRGSEETDTTALYEGMDAGKYTVKVIAKVGKKYTAKATAVEVTFGIAAPVVEIVEVTKTTITVKWNAINGATKYFVEMVGNDGRLCPGTTATTYTFTNLVPGTEYTFKVNAKLGVGKYTGYGNGTTVATDDAAKVEADAEVTVGGIVLTWDMPEADKFWVYRIVDGESQLLAATTANTVTVPSVEGANTFIICARVEVDGVRQYINSDEIVVTETQNPITLEATETLGGIELSWTAPGANKFWVYRVVDGESQLIAATTGNAITVPSDDGANSFIICARIKVNGVNEYVNSDVVTVG